MIEQSMIFALGFLVALLLVLFFLPAFWNRAIRLSIRKIGDRLPLSMAEVTAERDGLRAESAIVQRRLEQARDRAVEVRDAERAHVGRLTAQIAAHEIELDVLRLDATARDRILFETEHALLAAEAELGTMHKDHYDASAQLERAARSAEAMRSEQQRLRDLADQRRMTIASLETRIEGVQVKVDDLEANLRESERMRMLGTTGMAFGAGSYGHQPESAEAERLPAALAGGDVANHARAADISEFADRVRRLEAEKSALERDLAAARAGGGQEGADRQTADGEEIALLRKSISEVAAEVVRLSGLREPAADAPNVLQIRRVAGRDGHPKGPAGEPLQQGHGKSVGAT